MRSENPREKSREGDEHTQSETVASRPIVTMLVSSSRAAPDVSDPRALLRPLLRDAATRTLVALRSGASLDSAMGRAWNDLRSACGLARDRGLRAEQVLLLMKEEFRLLSAPRLIACDEAELVLERLVTMCILTYYTPDRS